MIEPSLFLTNRPDAAERFASNLRRRLDTLIGLMGANYHPLETSRLSD